MVDQVRQRLAAEIVAGFFPPGFHLDEKTQADRLGVSRTPLREALRQLAAIGWVHNRPHRGVLVSAGVAECLVETLAELNANCCRRACVALTDEQRAGVRSEFDRGGDWMRLVVRQCGNPVLAAVAEPLWATVFDLAGDVCAGCAPDLARGLVDGVMAGDPAAAADFGARFAQACALRALARAVAGEVELSPLPPAP